MRRLLLAALLCAWVAGAIAFGSTDHAMRAPRDLVRPVALPFLWRSLADAAEIEDALDDERAAERHRRLERGERRLRQFDRRLRCGDRRAHRCFADAELRRFERDNLRDAACHRNGCDV